MLRSYQRPERISKRPSYVECKLSRASIRTALRKSKTSVDVTSESVAKQACAYLFDIKTNEITKFLGKSANIKPIKKMQLRL